MKEILDIIRAYDKALQQGMQAALATVVHVEGSSYRQPGARMLITEDGRLTGAISGGCLEGDALRKALLVMAQKKAMLVTYDTMDEDDAKLGVGLGCNGIIQVLIEPIQHDVPTNPVQLLRQLTVTRQKGVLVSLFSLQNRNAAQTGTCFLLKTDGTSLGALPLHGEVILNDAHEALLHQRSSFRKYLLENGEMTAFVELVKPAISLVIAGAGNDAIPLVQIANVLGWETTVVDGRPHYATRERFPSATHVMVAKADDILRQISLDDQTVFVLVTHNYNYDKTLLRQLIETNVVYAGMLGPKKKRDRMLTELQAEGLALTRENLSIIHSPIGLDIGAETAEEIALSIIAEIQTVLTGREGQSLRTNKQTIHSRDHADIAVKKIT